MKLGEQNMDTDLSKFVGSKIKEYRKKKGLTQKELGEKIGVKHNTISAYEKGTISPEQDMLFALSNALDVGIDSFFPTKNETDDFERALQMAKSLDIKDMNFLNELIQKTLSLNEEERAKFIDSIKFTIDYHEKLNK